MQRNLIASLAALAVLSSASGCSSGAARMDSIAVAWSPFESTALVWIAQEQQFFSRNSLAITLRKYDTGVGSLDGVVNGEADLVVGPTEFPLVGRAFQNTKIRTVASIAKSEFIYVVGRKDRGVEKAADLKGKRVGTTARTIAEFFLGRYLELNGLTLKDVILVDVTAPADWVEAVVRGDIDAIATAQPYANSAKERLGANATILSAQSSRPLFAQVIATEAWINKHPELVTKFLRALAQAEEYVRNPAQAKAVVQQSLNLDAAYMETVWSQNQFSLSLDQSLIAAMEDEARWMIKNDLTAENQMPNFLDYIYEDSLKQVKPEAVNIIR
ncbi:MAG: NrtA/SsuA/CpmA family ABC transporter substrate-binding protein [Chloroflexi bacterium]|nr:NrtA/SsuA/CpmA family ABC transporter substrate-binding protein [Chloroflexota bacterium]